MDDTSTAQAIKDRALDLLVRHGYRGMSFGDISSALGMTRANVHYHFGNKQALVEQVLRDYVEATLGAIRKVWSAEGASFAQKVEAMLAFSLARYRRFNPAGSSGRPWSLIARLRQDADLLTPDGRLMLLHFRDELTALLTAALEEGRRRGEFASGIPVAAVALHLATIADNASAVTLDTDGPERLRQLYRGIAEIIDAGFRP